MEHYLTTTINNEKIKMSLIPLRFFDKSTCDMSIRINVPTETKTVELKLYWMVIAGGSSGGGGASYGFGATLDEACDEIITILAWSYSGYHELKPLILEAGYKTENKKDYTTYAYTRYMKTSASNNLYTTAIDNVSKPNYIEIYCGKRLVKTIGSKSSSNTNLNEVGTYTWYNGVWQSNGSSEVKTPVTFESYSDSVQILPFVNSKPTIDEASDTQTYCPCINVEGVTYYYGQKMVTPEGIIKIYKNGVPDVIGETIDKEIEGTSVSDVANSIPIGKLTFSKVLFSNGKAGVFAYYTNPDGSIMGDTYSFQDIEYEPGPNVEVLTIYHRDGNGELIAMALIAFDTSTNQMLSSHLIKHKDVTGSIKIENLGDGYFGIRDENGMTVNGHNMGSTYIENNKSTVDGLSGVSFRYEQNMGNGYHKLLGSDGKYYVYDAATNTYKPM